MGEGGLAAQLVRKLIFPRHGLRMVTRRLDQTFIKLQRRRSGFRARLICHVEQSLLGVFIEIRGGLGIRGKGTIRTLGSRRFDLGLLRRCARSEDQRDGNQSTQHRKCTYARWTRRGVGLKGKRYKFAFFTATLAPRIGDI